MAKSKRTVKKTSRKKSATRLRKSPPSSVKKPELKYIPWHAVELEELTTPLNVSHDAVDELTLGNFRKRIVD